jgi:hypothetical protein
VLWLVVALRVLLRPLVPLVQLLRLRLLRRWRWRVFHMPLRGMREWLVARRRVLRALLLRLLRLCTAVRAVVVRLRLILPVGLSRVRSGCLRLPVVWQAADGGRMGSSSRLRVSGQR